MNAPSPSLLVPWVIVGACVAILASNPPSAHAATADLCWFVPSGNERDDWSLAAEQTWPGGTLRIEVWDGLWPPTHADGVGAHAFLGTTDGHSTLYVRDTEGGDTSLPLDADDGASHESRCSILLILRGMASPLGIGDGGWMPTPPEPSEDEDIAPDGEPPPTTAPPTPSPLSFSIAMGVSGRLGLDSPSVAPAVSPALRLASTDSIGLYLATDLVADLGGRVDLGSVPARLDSVLLAGGLEVRPTVGQTAFGFRVAGGAHVHWARLPDRADAPTLTSTRPALRVVGKVGWQVARGVHVGFQTAWTVDLIAAEAPIRLELHQGDGQAVAEVAGWSLAGQAFVELRGHGVRRAP